MRSVDADACLTASHGDHRSGRVWVTTITEFPSGVWSNSTGLALGSRSHRSRSNESDRLRDGQCYTMRGTDITDHMRPVHELFEYAREASAASDHHRHRRRRERDRHGEDSARDHREEHPERRPDPLPRADGSPHRRGRQQLGRVRPRGRGVRAPRREAAGRPVRPGPRARDSRSHGPRGAARGWRDRQADRDRGRADVGRVRRSR